GVDEGERKPDLSGDEIDTGDGDDLPGGARQRGPCQRVSFSGINGGFGLPTRDGCHQCWTTLGNEPPRRPALRYTPMTGALNAVKPAERRRANSGGAWSAGRGRHEAALAALRAHPILPDESPGAGDPRRGAVAGGRIDPDCASKATLAEPPASMGQQERCNLVSRDHRWWPKNGWSSAAGLRATRNPARSGAIPSWTDCIAQRAVARCRRRSRPDQRAETGSVRSSDTVAGPGSRT